MTRRLGFILAVTVLVLAAAPARAHHSFAPFDLTAERTITGTLKQFDWTNPHT